ncbi:unnamed protein product, partial [Rotaria magnacalcarata]
VPMAKENFKHPVDGLTQDESAAIHLYGMQWDSGNEEVDETLSEIPPVSRQIVCWEIRKDDGENYQQGDHHVKLSARLSCKASLPIREADLHLDGKRTRASFYTNTVDRRNICSLSILKTGNKILLLRDSSLKLNEKLNSASNLHIIHSQPDVISTARSQHTELSQSHTFMKRRTNLQIHKKNNP